MGRSSAPVSADQFAPFSDCFLTKGQVTFALQDYEQALELAPNNHEIKIRISNVFFGNAERQYKEKHYQVSGLVLQSTERKCEHRCYSFSGFVQRIDQSD